MSALPDIVRSHLASLSPKEVTFVTAMCWEGLKLAEAAKRAGFSERYGYMALRKPEVRKALRDEMQVMRQSMRPRALLQLADVSDQKANLTASVMASKAILADEEGAKAALVNINITPGYAVDLSDRPRVTVIDHQADEVIRVDDGAADRGDENE